MITESRKLALRALRSEEEHESIGLLLPDSVTMIMDAKRLVVDPSRKELTTIFARKHYFDYLLK